MDRNEYNKICQCKSAKEIWKLLVLMKEQIKLNSQKSIYLFIVMNFFMKDNETIVKMITGFTDIINDLEALEKTYKELEKVFSLLRLVFIFSIWLCVLTS